MPSLLHTLSTADVLLVRPEEIYLIKLFSWWISCLCLYCCTHWGRVTHICVSKLAIIGSDNGSSPGRRQASIWTNDGILLIRTLGTKYSEILSEIRAFSFKKMDLKMSPAKWRPFCPTGDKLTSCLDHFSVIYLPELSCLYSFLWKTESCHDGNFVVTGGHGNCRYNDPCPMPFVTTNLSQR